MAACYNKTDLKAICVSYALFLSVVCPCLGQALYKKPVTEADYNLWGTLYLDKISDKGNWVSYTMHYDEHPDTLYLASRNGKVKYAFPKGTASNYSREKYFALLIGNTLKVVCLQDGKEFTLDDVSAFSISGDGKHLITQERTGTLSRVTIRTPEGKPLKILEGITSYKLSNAGRMLICISVYDSLHQVQLIALASQDLQVTEVDSQNSNTFKNIVWAGNGKAFSYIREGTDGTATICFYAIAEKKLYVMDAGTMYGFPKNFHIDSGYSSGLSLSADGKRVLFSIEKDAGYAKTADGIQLWNGNDALTYAEHALIIREECNRRIVAWLPFEQKMVQVTDDEKPFGFLNATQDYALVYAMDDMAPQYKLDHNVNYSLINLNTGERKVFLQNQPTGFSDSGLSPDGRYFAYYRDDGWNVYNFATGKHTPLRAGNTQQFTSLDELGNIHPYGIAGWDSNTHSLLLYDAYDIWKIPLDGTKSVRLTSGKEKKIRYRIVEPKSSEFLQSNFRGHINPSYNLAKGLLLSAKSDNETGYFQMGASGKLRKVVFDNRQNSDIIQSTDAELYAFIAQDFDIPPILKICQVEKSVEVIANSNPHHNKYAWGKLETIYYKALQQDLKGLLYYPANFDASKQYPMVVLAYEDQYFHLHTYTNPSRYNMTGFNVSNLTSKGYFVLLPDIVYRAGNPGISATECVLNATDEACRKAPVDNAKIGLIGHSFGGYETNFIITQTDRFACAVSGASVADLQSHYLSIGWYTGRPEIWRFENQQWRMGVSLFESPEKYLVNSPLHKVTDIKTPLFLWTGEEDRQVHYHQSIAFYLALRRLGKEEIMVIYPDEGHAILKPENQADLTRRTEEWFDYYLKKENPSLWMRRGIK